MAVTRYNLVLWGAVFVGVLASFGAYKVLKNARFDGAPTRPVVVASRDVPEGTALDPAYLSVVPWPASTVPEGASAVPDSFVGRVTMVPIFRGDPIVPGRLAPTGSGPGLEVKIAPGRRAMAVKIDDVAGISGLIQPNSRVDVLVTLRTDPTGNRQVAKLFMENMRVLSVGTKVQRGEDGKAINATTATLEVSPDEAERLAVAMNQGSIQLVLRGFGDPDSVRTTGANSSDVLAQLRTGGSANVSAGRVNGAGGEVSDEHRATTTARSRSRRSAAPRTPPVTTPAAPATSSVVVPPAAPDSATVRVYRGGTLSQQKFPKADTNATRPRATTP